MWNPHNEKHPSRFRHRISNCSDYNRALINRGDFTLWVSEDVIEVWLEARETERKGHPYIYADAAIECMLILKNVFRLPLRH